MESTKAPSGTSGSAGAPETVPTGYQGGTPTGGAAATSASVSRDLNESSAFATEASPAAQVTNITTLQSEFPEEVGDFQAAQEAKRTAVAEQREAEKANQPNFGLVQNPETGEYEWAPLTDAAGSTDEGTAASRKNFDSSTFTAYNSTDVENTLVAFSEASSTEEVEEGTQDYYYGLLEDEFLPTNREDDSGENV